MARSTPVARFAARLRNHLHGIVVEHLGHDIDMSRNGELWIIRQLAPGSRIFVDVGANIGDWTGSFLSIEPTAKGFLIEASRAAAKALSNRFERDQRVQIRHVAASDRSGTVTFFEEPNAGQTSSLVPGFSSGDATHREVEAVTLDSLLAAERVEQVDYLKIDAEGHDLHVLRGAEGLLRGARIRALQFEYNRPWQKSGSTLAEAFRFLEALRYEAFLLKGPRLHRFPYELYGEFFHYANFVAFPADRVSSVRHLIGGSI